MRVESSKIAIFCFLQSHLSKFHKLLCLSTQSASGFSLPSKQMTLNDLEQPFCAKYCFLSGIV